jgi:hypothetical protein
MVLHTDGICEAVYLHIQRHNQFYNLLYQQELVQNSLDQSHHREYLLQDNPICRRILGNLPIS